MSPVSCKGNYWTPMSQTWLSQHICSLTERGNFTFSTGAGAGSAAGAASAGAAGAASGMAWSSFLVSSCSDRKRTQPREYSMETLLDKRERHNDNIRRKVCEHDISMYLRKNNEKSANKEAKLLIPSWPLLPPPPHSLRGQQHFRLKGGRWDLDVLSPGRGQIINHNV